MASAHVAGALAPSNVNSSANLTSSELLDAMWAARKALRNAVTAAERSSAARALAKLFDAQLPGSGAVVISDGQRIWIGQAA